MLNVRIITIMPKKLTTEVWINKARIKHGDKYDYCKSVYTGSRDRIIYTIQVPNEINTSGHAYIDFYLPEYNTFL